MASILDTVEQQLDDDSLDQISRQLGTDPATARSAISLALPVLLGGLAQHAQSPQGAQMVDQAIQASPPIPDDQPLSSALGLLGGLGGQQPAAHSLGAVDANALGLGGLGGALGGAMGGSGGGGLGDILGQVLGGAGGGAPVQDGLSKATGLNQSQIGRLLMMLAPLVLAHLARRQQSGQSTGDVLRQERTNAEARQPGLGGILGKMFDKNNDGSIIDDITRMAGGGR